MTTKPRHHALLRPLPLMLVAALALSGCARLGQSRLNPLNWLGPSRPAAAAPVQAVVPDTRLPVARITDMAIEPTESGAILRATGVAPGVGWHNARLVRVADEAGVLTYALRAEPPPGGTGAGTQVITAARSLGLADLAGVTLVRVLGQENAREARR
ncbi:MAG: hypothetical protein H3C51_01345 [Rubellimicrobium sp.]|nr:hypothetical protein [Rubellimicrobium sp.]